MLRLSAGYGEALTLFRAAEIAGEPLIFPTDTIYGIGAPIASVSANEKIFTIKKRPFDKPLPLLVGDMDTLYTLVDRPSEMVLKWLADIWPGPYTVIFRALPWLAPLYTKGGTVAVRMVGSGWLGDALRSLGKAVSATSVNESGQTPLYDAAAIYTEYKEFCPFMLHGISGDKSSTVIDISEGTPQTIRNT